MSCFGVLPFHRFIYNGMASKGLEEENGHSNQVFSFQLNLGMN